jgi:2-dehydro-3-deoxygluconokinase
MRKKVITFGDIMMRLSTPGFARFTQAENFNVLYGGSEANVAVGLANLGIPAEHVTRFPDNDFGRAATQSLQKYGVATNHILYGEERMGIYFVENGSMQRAARIIYDRFDSAFTNIKKGSIDWDAIMKDASWFHWTGITPALSQGAADVCFEALQSARKHQVMISGDINYRRNLWQYGKSARDVMPELISLTDRIVAGVTDMENCADITDKTFESASQKMMKAYPNLQKIVSTHRESISASHNKFSAHLWDGKKIIQSKEYDLIPVVDRIGTGDAFMAGLIYGWSNNKDDQTALEFATAAGVWKHSIEGDVNLASASEIESLMRGENIGKLLR